MIFPELATQFNLFHNIILFKEIMENLIGKKFNKWTIISYIGRDKKSELIYECECVCGDRRNHALSTLKTNKSTQCKKCFLNIHNKITDITGKKFGYWTTLERYKNEKRNEWYYKCQCECGTVKNIPGYRLQNGTSKKCPRCRVKTHGMSYTDTFKIWAGILRRCLNQNFKAYKHYGGRGIKVCERWLKFENFFNDMGHRPTGLQIDRIDNDGNYEPSNCRWVTPKENSNNKRRVN